MLASSDMAAERKPESEPRMASAARRLVSKALKFAAIMISVGTAAILIVSRGTALPWHWCAHEIAPLAGTLFLAVGVVLLANYLSAGRKSKAGQGGDIGYDRNSSLDL